MTPRALRTFRSLRWRLTFWYSGVLASVLTIFAIASLVVLSRVLASRSDRFLEEARGAYLVELEVELEELGTVEAAARAAVRDTRFRDTWIFVFDSSGTLLARGDVPEREGSWRFLRASPESVTATARRLALAPDGEAKFATIADDEGSYRALAAPLRLGNHRLAVVALQARHSILETIEQVAAGYLVVIPLVLILATLGGSLLARRALAPMAEMTRRTRAIGTANLDARLAVTDPHDEVGQLAEVVNDLIARLEAAIAQQRRFVADASHELRTPVTTVWTEADVALGVASRSEEEYRDSLRVVRDAGRRLSRIVEDLFLLTRIDAGHLPLAREPLYLDELLLDVARSLRAQALGRSVQIEVIATTDAPFVGDAGLLGRLFLNLLDNAIKHSPSGGVVRVELAGDGDRFRITVSDQGAGIPETARERIFERFFRADPSRSRGERSAPGGAGLGLAIARWVAEAHRGTLAHATRDVAGGAGATFIVALPLPATLDVAPAKAPEPRSERFG